MTRTLQAQAPWAILLLTAALVMAKLWLFARLVADVPPSERITELLFQLLPVSFAAVGTVIAARRPGHRVGWLLLGGSLAIAGAQLAWSYVIYSVSSGTSLPSSAAVGWVGNGSRGQPWRRLRYSCCCFLTASSPRHAGVRWPGPWSPGAR